MFFLFVDINAELFPKYSNPQSANGFRVPDWAKHMDEAAFNRRVCKVRGIILQEKAIASDPSIIGLNTDFVTPVRLIAGHKIQFCGRIDGIRAIEGASSSNTEDKLPNKRLTLVEIKSKAPPPPSPKSANANAPGEPWPNDYAQVQLYMHFYHPTFQNAELVFRHNQKNTSVKVEYDEFYWEFYVLPKLHDFFSSHSFSSLLASRNQ